MRMFIKEWRKVRGMTQARLAQHLSMSPSTLRRYETGCGRIYADTLGQIAEVLQIPVSLFFLEDAVPTSDETHMESILTPVDDEATAQVLHEILQDQLRRLHAAPGARQTAARAAWLQGRTRSQRPLPLSLADRGRDGKGCRGREPPLAAGS